MTANGKSIGEVTAMCVGFERWSWYFANAVLPAVFIII